MDDNRNYALNIITGLDYIRRYKGMTTYDIAETLEVSPQTVSNWLNMKTSMPLWAAMALAHELYMDIKMVEDFHV